MPSDSCCLSVQTRVALLFAATVLQASTALAAADLSQQDKRSLGSCSSLGAAILKSASAFPEEWRQLGTSLMFMPAVIEPPLKDDPDFQAGRQRAEESLGGVPPSPKSPAYAQAFIACAAWAEPFMQRHAR